ncbi:MAG: inositol monophosphatase family protein [Planctomycetota bacterium]
MPEKVITIAERIAREAGEIVMRYHSCLDPDQVQYKGEIDIVTRADLESERHIVSRIRETLPHHTISAEEEVNEPAGAHHWIVDPLDGTTNFAHSLPVFSISLGYLINGKLEAGVVHAPYLNETFTAVRGQGAFLNHHPIRVSTRSRLKDAVLATGFCYHRKTVKDNNVDAFRRFVLDVQGMRRMGVASMDLCYVACGRFDGYWEPHLSPHDVAAGALVVLEAGGTVSDYLGGDDFMAMRRIVASNGILHSSLLERLDYIA